MIGVKSDADLKAVKSFVELWAKFHHMYNDIFSRGSISKEDEDKYLETRNAIGAKYDELQRIMEFRYTPHGRLTDPVSDVLAVKTIRLISEANLKKLNADWKDSYIFLNGILERLKEKKARGEELSPIGTFLRRIFSGK
jgi:hypothetical protein